MIRAGLPATTVLSGTSLTTTLPAPITTLFPILIFPITSALAPMVTLFPIVGKSLGYSSDLLPMVVHCLHVKSEPIDLALRIVEKGWAR